MRGPWSATPRPRAARGQRCSRLWSMQCWCFGVVVDPSLVTKAAPIESPPISAQAALRKKATFAGDVAKLVSGTTIAQAIGVLLSPLLTRMYAPEAFGTLALFSAITSIIGVAACLRYELAIMLPKTDDEAANLLAVSLLSVVAITMLSIPTVILGRPLLLRLLKAPDLGPYLWLVPVIVFFGGVFSALNYWNSRSQHFGRLSVVRVVSSATTYAANLGAGYAGHATTSTLISGTLLGSVISTGMLARSIWREDSSLFRLQVRWQRMLHGMKRYQRFPLIDVWSALLNTISWQLPALMLGYFFSSTVVGYYSLGLRVLQVPMSLIGGAIAQVFFQRAAEAKAHGTLDQVVRSAFQRLATIGLFPMLLIGVSGRDMFVLFFGSQWAPAGTYAQILSLWTFFWFVSSPLSTLFFVLEKQSLLLSMNIAILLTRCVSLWLGGISHDPITAVSFFAASGAIMYGYLSLKVLNLCGVSWTFFTTVLGRVFLRFIPVALLLVGCKFGHVSAWVVSGVVSFSLAFYYYYTMRSDIKAWASTRLPIRLHLDMHRVCGKRAHKPKC